MIRRFAALIALSGLAALGACTLRQAQGDSGGAVIPGAERAGAPVIREFDDLLGRHSHYNPTAVVYGPGGDLWIADNFDPDFGEAAIVRVSTTGRHLASYSTGGVYAGIAAGSDGALWGADGSGFIFRVGTDGKYSYYSLRDKYPNAITAGPDGALWFTATFQPHAYIGRITTSGYVKTFSGLSPGSWPEGITTGPDGNLWFAESQNDRIGRITPSGSVTEFSNGISKTASPWAIAAGSDGALWFTENGRAGIGRITTSGQVTEYRKGISAHEHPFYIALGGDGAMWFTEFGYAPHRAPAKIGRIATDGTITEYDGIGRRSIPAGITADPRGDLWFVEEHTDLLGRVRL